MSRVLSFDPSGNFGSEGMGTTGWALFEDGELLGFGEIKASDYDCQEHYFNEHMALIFDKHPNVIVCESYRLFGHKAKQQHGSSLDTPQLIGFLRMLAWNAAIDWVVQDPSNKTPVADPILVRRGVFELRGNKHYCMGKPTNLHMRDAIRHGMFYYRHGKGKGIHGNERESNL